jgi:tRNA (guanine37-N1)-methyltransferase
MKGRAVIVPRTDGERARRTLAEAGVLRTDLSIRADGEFLLLPIATGARVPSGLGPESEEEFEPVPPSGPSDYRDLLPWSDEERALAPRSFDVVGDLVLVRVPPALAPRSQAIGEALLGFVPGVRLVGADEGVHGVARRRTLVPLAGSGTWRTRHRENGVELEVDLELAYFSPRLAREHARVAAEVRDGERVYDLCCGVGPFAATIARDGRAASVVAVDSNPHAIDLLRATLRRVPNGSRVEARVVDVGEFVASAPPVERVILNLPHEGIKYVPSVARAVAHRGRLYYYEVTPRTEVERRGETIVRSFDHPGAWTVRDPEVVHPYSPIADLVVFEFDHVPRAGRP